MTHRFLTRHLRGVLALLFLGAVASVGARADTAQSGTLPAQSTQQVAGPAVEPRSDEINVATKALGASVRGDVWNLDRVLSNQPDARALMVPGMGKGAVVGAIDLGGVAKLSRVAITFAPAKGRLVLMGLTGSGKRIEAGAGAKAAGIISDVALDGSQGGLSVDVPNMAVKSLAIYWVSNDSNTPFVIFKVGVFSREPLVATSAVQPPVVPLLVSAPATSTTATASPAQSSNAPTSQVALPVTQAAASQTAAPSASAPVPPASTQSVTSIAAAQEPLTADARPVSY